MPYRFNVFTGTLDLINNTGTGDVTGIAPTTSGAIATWVDTNATTIQNTNTNVQASGAIEAQGYITNRNISGTVTVNGNESWIAPALTLEPGSNVVIEPGGELIII
jgi:hypothetical protein